MDRIKINKKDYPVCFGFNGLKELENISGSSLLSGVNKSNLSVTFIIQMTYVGLIHGAKKEGDKFNYTIEDVGDWLTDSPGVTGEVIKIFTESMPDVGKKK